MNSTWNHRVMCLPSENGGDDWFTIQEVYYEDGVVVGYADPCVGGDTLEELKETITRFYGALGQPVLHENEFCDENAT